MAAKLHSAEIQAKAVEYIQANGFDAPYGVLTGEHVNRNGRKYLSVTFGRSRTLDATLEIYNHKFIIIRTSSRGDHILKSVEDLWAFLELL